MTANEMLIHDSIIEMPNSNVSVSIASNGQHLFKLVRIVWMYEHRQKDEKRPVSIPKSISSISSIQCIRYIIHFDGIDWSTLFTWCQQMWWKYQDLKPFKACDISILIASMCKKFLSNVSGKYVVFFTVHIFQCK